MRIISFKLNEWIKMREREKIKNSNEVSFKFYKFIRFGLNGRTENERLKKLMKTNILADYNERNLEMIRNPV